MPKPLLVRTQAGRHTVALPGQTLALTFHVLHRSSDPYSPEVDMGAAYRLSVGAGDFSTTIEDGQRRRPNVIDYRLGHAQWFPSPNGVFGALILERIERGFEGAHATWMSNGVRVKARPKRSE